MAEGLSKYMEESAIKAIVGNAAFPAKPAKVFLALCQSEVKPGETGKDIESAEAGKANECVSATKKYEGYARIELPEAEWEFSGENPVKAVNKALIQFAACKAGSAKVTYAALCDKLTEGNVLWYGKVAEFEVSTTNTPAEVQAKALELTIK